MGVGIIGSSGSLWPRPLRWSSELDLVSLEVVALELIQKFACESRARSAFTDEFALRQTFRLAR